MRIHTERFNRPLENSVDPKRTLGHMDLAQHGTIVGAADGPTRQILFDVKLLSENDRRCKSPISSHHGWAFLAGYWQETDGTKWLNLSSADPILVRIIELWDDLPEYVQAAVVDLCRAQNHTRE